jgi:acetylornithine deacetylase/succinyl-diaminopimelate desuccinylase-like protein
VNIPELVLALLEVPAWVRPGAVEADADAVAAAVEAHIVPIIGDCGPEELRIHPTGDVAARFGPDRSDGLVLSTYVVAQHGDPDEQRPRMGEGTTGPVAIGRGAAQCRGAMASAIAAVSRLGGGREPARPVWLCVNTEASSSHGGSKRIFDDLGVTGRAGVLMTGTDLRISVANRGRVDVVVHVDGASCHSSQPGLGDNPFDRLGEVLDRLAAVGLPEPHGELGPVTVTPFAVRAVPVAPHSIPERLELTIDRRLLPGEHPAAAVAAIADALRDVRGVRIDEGRHMLPALVDVDDDIVSALRSACTRRGGDGETMVSKNTFDAGYACAAGIPTPMFGPGRRHFDAGMLEPESVAVADCAFAADVISDTIDALCR